MPASSKRCHRLRYWSGLCGCGLRCSMVYRLGDWSGLRRKLLRIGARDWLRDWLRSWLGDGSRSCGSRSKFRRTSSRTTWSKQFSRCYRLPCNLHRSGCGPRNRVWWFSLGRVDGAALVQVVALDCWVLHNLDRSRLSRFLIILDTAFISMENCRHSALINLQVSDLEVQSAP